MIMQLVNDVVPNIPEPMLLSWVGSLPKKNSKRKNRWTEPIGLFDHISINKIMLYVVAKCLVPKESVIKCQTTILLGLKRDFFLGRLRAQLGTNKAQLVELFSSQDSKIKNPPKERGKKIIKEYKTTWTKVSLWQNTDWRWNRFQTSFTHTKHYTVQRCRSFFKVVTWLLSTAGVSPLFYPSLRVQFVWFHLSTPKSPPPNPKMFSPISPHLSIAGTSLSGHLILLLKPKATPYLRRKVRRTAEMTMVLSLLPLWRRSTRAVTSSWRRWVDGCGSSWSFGCLLLSLGNVFARAVSLPWNCAGRFCFLVHFLSLFGFREITVTRFIHSCILK